MRSTPARRLDKQFVERHDTRRIAKILSLFEGHVPGE
jgi:hypothetical protein